MRKVSKILILNGSYVCLVEEFITSIDPNHDGQITEEEFSGIMKYISMRSNASLPALNSANKFKPNQSHQSTSRSHQMQQADITMQVYEQDKKKYGALLPKTGVYFLPDEKVLGFLK